MPPKSRRSGSRPMTMRDIKTRFANANLNDNPAGVPSSVAPKDDPITRKVPVEITAHIFLCYVNLHRKEGNLADEPTFGFDEIPVDAPLRLGAVCRRWREIAWDTPALWTILVVDLMSKGHAHGPELVKEWLERSAELPVNVALRLHVDAFIRHQQSPIALKGHRKHNAKAVVKAINKYWPKLESIDLRDVPWDLATMLNGDAPSALENLCVGGFGNDDIELDDPLFLQTAHKHSPAGLSLLSSIPPLHLNIDWSKLTTLNIDDTTRAIVFEVITLCAATLTNVTLKAINDVDDDLDVDDDPWMPHRVITLPALIAISFMEMDSQEGFSETLFDHITAPALKSIWYYGLEEDNEMPVDTIVSFIRRSACNIVHFLMHDPSIMILDSDIDDDGYMPLLRAMPGLRMLDISLGAGLAIEPLFFALAQRDPRTDAPTFLPRLKTLNCTVHPMFEWALFPEIWTATHPSGHQIGDPDFKFAEIRVARARAKLAMELTLRGPLDEEDFMEGEALMALIAIKGQVHADITVTTDLEGQLALGGRKFLERSFLYRFPKKTHPEYFRMFQAFKMMEIF